jgi:threonine synthase
VNNVCTRCGGALFTRYDIERVKESLAKEKLAGRAKSLWRYRELLPVRNDGNIVTLGEGFTPILKLKRGANVLMKDDGVIPTGTFKARGQTTAISEAKELGITSVAIPSVGNAGAAMACYAARAGMRARVYMPKDAPEATRKECEAYGAEVVLADGTIEDAAAKMRAGIVMDKWFEMSTLKEPYRLEGKKTMGMEIFEQMGFRLPDVIVYPTGGGTGLIGMWKAFQEMEELGWLKEPRPRMISVQSSGCAPIVKAVIEGKSEVTESYPELRTIAAGLRVPKPFASELILKVISESRGMAVAVTDEEILRSMKKLASKEGVFAAPEGAATLAAYDKLVETGDLGKDEDVVLYNTGSGLKYLELS